MTLSFLLVPWDFAGGFVIFLLVVGGIVWYALRTKGDVCAMFSHGRTVLKLEAKERYSG